MAPARSWEGAWIHPLASGKQDPPPLSLSLARATLSLSRVARVTGRLTILGSLVIAIVHSLYNRFYNFRHKQNFTIFYEGLQRPLDFFRQTGDSGISIVKKIDALHFSLSPNDTMICADRNSQCKYPDTVQDGWNISSVYLAESIGSFPQWSYQEAGDETLDRVQLAYNPENKREWGVDIEPRMGIALRTVIPFQYNYFVGPTDVLHQNIWTPANDSQRFDGAWSVSPLPPLSLIPSLILLSCLLTESCAFVLFCFVSGSRPFTMTCLLRSRRRTPSS